PPRADLEPAARPPRRLRPTGLPFGGDGTDSTWAPRVLLDALKCGVRCPPAPRQSDGGSTPPASTSGHQIYCSSGLVTHSTPRPPGYLLARAEPPPTTRALTLGLRHAPYLTIGGRPVAKYTDAQRAEALAALEANGGNLS